MFWPQRDLFHQIDTNGNGNIDIEELRKLSNVAHVHLSESELKSTWAEMDRDESGGVDIDEVEHPPALSTDQHPSLCDSNPNVATWHSPWCCFCPAVAVLSVVRAAQFRSWWKSTSSTAQKLNTGVANVRHCPYFSTDSALPCGPPQGTVFRLRFHGFLLTETLPFACVSKAFISLRHCLSLATPQVHIGSGTYVIAAGNTNMQYTEEAAGSGYSGLPVGSPIPLPSSARAARAGPVRADTFSMCCGL